MNTWLSPITGGRDISDGRAGSEVLRRDSAAWLDGKLTALGLPLPVLLWAAVAAVFIGAAYALSPMTVWFSLAMALLFSYAGRGLFDRERRWVLGVLAVALVLRVSAIAGFFLLTDHTYQHESFASLFGDEDWIKARSIGIRNVWLGIPISPRQFTAIFVGYGSKAYNYWLAFLQVVLGPMPYGVHLLNVGLFLAGAVVLHRMIRHAYGSLPAFGGFSILLFLPTLFVWSVSALKESLYFLLTVMALVAAVKVARVDAWSKRLLAFAISVGAGGAIGNLRSGAFAVTVFAIVLGFVTWFITRRVWLLAASLLVVLVAGGVAVSQPDIQDRIADELRHAAALHLGHVHTPGYHYRLLDQQFYHTVRPPVDSMTTPEVLRFAVRAVLSFVVVPLPWQVNSWPALAFLSQQVIWYILVGLAAIGFPVGLRKDPLITGMLVGYILVNSVIVALTSGNIGSLVRHRDMIVPYVAMLSALGAYSVLMRLVQRTRNDGSEDSVAT